MILCVVSKNIKNMKNNKTIYTQNYITLLQLIGIYITFCRILPSLNHVNLAVINFYLDKTTCWYDLPSANRENRLVFFYQWTIKTMDGNVSKDVGIIKIIHSHIMQVKLFFYN